MGQEMYRLNGRVSESTSSGESVVSVQIRFSTLFPMGTVSDDCAMGSATAKFPDMIEECFGGKTRKRTKWNCSD